MAASLDVVGRVRGPGFIYLIRLREFVRSGEPVLKVGRAADVASRSKGYPKGSVVVYTVPVLDMYAAETRAIGRLKASCLQCRQYGTEYFSGDLGEMKLCLDTAAGERGEFVRVAGPIKRPSGEDGRSPEVTQLMCVLFPESERSGLPPLSRKLRRATLIEEMVRALGFTTILDTRHVVSDMMGIWAARLHDTAMFKEYHDNMELFGRKRVVEVWTASAVSKAINMVLRSCGLGLVATRHRPGTGAARITTHVMDEARVESMVEQMHAHMRGGGVEARG